MENMENMERRIEIGGRALRLYYTVNALCAVEERAGGSLDNLMERQFSATRLLLWGGLMERQPEITLARAGELISEHIACGGSLEDIVNECALALSRAGFFAGEAE